MKEVRSGGMPQECRREGEEEKLGGGGVIRALVGVGACAPRAATMSGAIAGEWRVNSDSTQ